MNQIKPPCTDLSNGKEDTSLVFHN